jgi:hypothetical protein
LDWQSGLYSLCRRVARGTWGANLIVSLAAEAYN